MARCNGCSIIWLRRQYGPHLVRMRDMDGTSYYACGALPARGQSDPTQLADGTPLRFLAWFMAEGHSLDEDCRIQSTTTAEHLLRPGSDVRMIGPADLPQAKESES